MVSVLRLTKISARYLVILAMVTLASAQSPAPRPQESSEKPSSQASSETSGRTVIDKGKPKVKFEENVYAQKPKDEDKGASSKIKSAFKKVGRSLASAAAAVGDVFVEE